MVIDSNTITLLNFSNTDILEDKCGRVWQSVGKSVSLDTEKHAVFIPFGSYIHTTDTMDLGTSDYTIDFWVLADKQTSSYPILISADRFGRVPLTCHELRIGDGNGLVQFNFDTSQWNHCAVVQNNGYVNVYKNGICLQHNECSTSQVINAIGMAPYSTANTQFTGYMSNFRISNIARWTAAFTPPYRLGYNSIMVDKKDNYYGILKE